MATGQTHRDTAENYGSAVSAGSALAGIAADRSSRFGLSSARAARVTARCFPTRAAHSSRSTTDGLASHAHSIDVRDCVRERERIPLRRRRASVHDTDAFQPHDHVAWFGDRGGDLYAVATAALADGARRGEKLMFVAEDPDPAGLTGIDGLERLLATGQLELAAIDAVYGNGNAFSASDQLATFEGVLADALAEGYRGIRVVADNTPLAGGDNESFRRWLEWEQLTDRFQAASMVTGVCFFDHAALSGERRADLAAIHPVRSANGGGPPFSAFSDGDAVFVTGKLDGSSAEQFRRILGTAPVDRPLVVDLSGAEFVDRQPLLVLAESASADRPLRVRSDRHLRELVSLIGSATPHLRFERDATRTPTCARCGDWIGTYEPAVIVLDGARRVTSRAAEPDAVATAAERYHRACYTDR